MSCDLSGGCLFLGWGQVHQVYFYIKGVTSLFSSTGKLINYIYETIVIPGNVN